MKKLTLMFLVLASINLTAQDISTASAKIEDELKNLKENVQTLQKENQKLKSDVNSLLLKQNELNLTCDSLNKQITANNSLINETAKQLGIRIVATEETSNQKIEIVNQSLSKKSLLAIIGILLAIIISGIIYWLLSKRQKTDKTDFINQLSKTKSSIEESLVKEFGKQTELLESQLQLIEEQGKNQSSKATNQEIDHSLALKVADEITLIERNISLMDKDVKGLKQLSRSVQKLKDNLNANGYEIPILLGKQFNQGMKLIVVSSIPDDNLNKWEEVISKIIKPQVNYSGKMLQAAQVEVSVG